MSVDQKDGTCSCESTQERAKLNKQLAQMLKGGVIMDVTTPEQARKKRALAQLWRSSASQPISDLPVAFRA